MDAPAESKTLANIAADLAMQAYNACIAARKSYSVDPSTRTWQFLVATQLRFNSAIDVLSSILPTLNAIQIAVEARQVRMRNVRMEPILAQIRTRFNLKAFAGLVDNALQKLQQQLRLFGYPATQLPQ